MASPWSTFTLTVPVAGPFTPSPEYSSVRTWLPTGSDPAGSAMLPLPPVIEVDPMVVTPFFSVTVPLAVDGVTVTGTEPASP